MLLALVLHGAVFTLLLLQKSAPIPRKLEDVLTTIALPAAREKGEQAKAKTREKDKAKDRESASAAPQPQPKPPEKPPETPPPPLPLGPGWLQMSSADFAASDISKMARVGKSSGQQSADNSAPYGPGEGPGGMTLYNADWYRKPTNAELDGYLAANAPRTGWGLIACQTIERYRVDNCRTLGEYPLGSGFGKAVREAAWQFQVIPPRVNGKPQVGAWVRIRISYGIVDETG